VAALRHRLAELDEIAGQLSTSEDLGPRSRSGSFTSLRTFPPGGDYPTPLPEH
jgi:hypothetical protein